MVFAAFALSPQGATAGPFQLSYSGRFTEANGKPVDGPVDLEVTFFHAASGGSSVLTAPLPFAQVPLVSGVFQITLDLAAADYQVAFPDVETPVFIQVTDATHNKPYPRQKVSMVPFAAKVPVDGTSVSYDDGGRLKVEAVDQGSVVGLDASLAAKSDASHSHTMVGDITGSVEATVVSKIRGNAVSSAVPTINQVLQWDGAKWTPTTVGGVGTPESTTASNLGTGSDVFKAQSTYDLEFRRINAGAGVSVTQNANDITIASTYGDHAAQGYIKLDDLTATAPLSYDNGTGAFSMGAASGISDGYLTSGSFLTFNNKQAAITGSTNVTLNNLTANGQVVLNNDAQDHGVTLKVKDLAATTWTMTLPDGDGNNLDVLQTDGAGVLSWTAIPAAPVTSVATKTGAVTLDADDVAATATRLWLSDTDKSKLDGITAGANMLKSAYDVDTDDKVDLAENAEKLNGQTASYYTNATNITSGTLPTAQVPNLDAAKITTGTFATARIADDAIDASKLADDASVDANRAVTTNHIRDAAVTNAKLGSGIDAGKVTTGTLPDGVIPAAITRDSELGTIAGQNADAVSITGGSISGITDLAVADGGTGASNLTGLVIGNGAGAMTALAASSGGQYLRRNSGDSAFEFAALSKSDVGLGNVANIDIRQSFAQNAAQSIESPQIKAKLAGNLALTDNAGNGITVLDGGDVGIGTTAPAAKLQIGRADPTFNDVGGVVVASGTGVGGARKYWLGASDPANSNNNNFVIGDYATDGDNTFTPLLTIIGAHGGGQSGNVGIGSATPGAKLDVAGQIKITGGTPGAGKVLVSDAAGLASWQTVAAPVLIQSITASNSATVDFTTGINSTYPRYRVEFINIRPVNNSVKMYMLMSQDGGSSWVTAANSYGWHHDGSDVASGALYYGADNSTFVDMIETGDSARYLPNGAGYSMSGTMELFDPAGTSVYKEILYSLGWTISGAAGRSTLLDGFGILKANTNAVNAIRFYMSSGNISSGTFRLYGIP